MAKRNPSKKVVEYILMWGCDEDKLVQDIQIKIEQGYQPYGDGSATGNSNGKTFFYQPMVKYS